MSYNGIGLSTPRGSATSGHIQRNISSIVRKDPIRSSSIANEARSQMRKQADSGILKHEAKRQIENKILLHRTELEEHGGLTSESLENKVLEYRAKLQADTLAGVGLPASLKGKYKSHQSHENTRLKEVEMRSFRQALGVSEIYQEGSVMQRSERPKRASPFDAAVEQPHNDLDRLPRGRRTSGAYSRGIRVDRLADESSHGSDIQRQVGSPRSRQADRNSGKLHSKSKDARSKSPKRNLKRSRSPEARVKREYQPCAGDEGFYSARHMSSKFIPQQAYETETGNEPIFDRRKALGID